tara:strand:- start:5328 stop:5615 length:288 start_codon:yes stop_codon:yes gene_type:complete
VRAGGGSLLSLIISKNFVSLQKKDMAHKKVNLDRVLDDMAGLDMYKGRLINNRPDGMMGIERAANMKRIIDEDRKIKVIADGIERAEMRKKYRML